MAALLIEAMHPKMKYKLNKNIIFKKYSKNISKI